ncbi:hypothetical protein BDR26DRAFT_924632 [Obelidium mucronatum]|nr:hypothetical protein BDR26DRAFT_924632 [Obelidium mucronatum]
MDASDNLPLTLRTLQESMAIISGHLGKFNTNSDASSPESRWFERFFVLGETGSLYLFRTDSDLDAAPISSLVLSNSFGYIDPIDNTPILRVQGPAMGVHGNQVNRTWTLRCPNEQTMAIWLRAIGRVMGSGQAFPKRRSVSQNPVSRSSSAASGSGEEQVPALSSSPSATDLDSSPRRSSFSSRVGMSRSTSVSSTNRSTISLQEREREARAKYQEYMAMQESAKERIQKELAIKREREREREEQERIAKEDMRKAKEAVKIAKQKLKDALARKNEEDKKRLTDERAQRFVDAVGLDSYGGYGVHNF